MEVKDLSTYAENTWCKGCGNFGILAAFKSAIVELAGEGVGLKRIVISSGIGCHAKIVDYVNVNSFYSIHGRVAPTLTGIKIANRELVAVGFAGDGDAYGEGLNHLLMSAKRNIDITMIIHNNRVYGLTTGQFTPTSPLGFSGKSTPRGSLEFPLNPIRVLLASGATFVARGYSVKTKHLTNLIKKAIKHKGFSFIDVLQPCFTFYNTYEYYNERVYEIEGHDASSLEKALILADQWDYNSDSKIPIGVFYEVEKPTFDELLLSGLSPLVQSDPPDIKSFIQARI